MQYLGVSPGPDLSAEAFVALRRHLFTKAGTPRSFSLRDKRQTQDDPLDEQLHGVVAGELESPDLRVQKAPGPLITPDMVLFAPEALRAKIDVDEEPSRAEAVGIEVKKLERTASGKVARATGLDFNTTPPSERIVVWGPSNERIEIPASYLFVVLEPAKTRHQVTALVMCDGALLNEDVDLYRRIVGERTKVIGLGSYGDGVDRQRPMLIFANPLSVSEFDSVPTLISASDALADSNADLELVGTIERTRADKSEARFFCYRAREDARRAPELELRDPFPTPARTEQTQSRGRCRLDLSR